MNPSITDNNIARQIYRLRYESELDLSRIIDQIKKFQLMGCNIFSQTVIQAFLLNDQDCLRIITTILDGPAKYDKDELEALIKCSQDSDKKDSVKYIRNYLNLFHLY